MTATVKAFRFAERQSFGARSFPVGEERAPVGLFWKGIRPQYSGEALGRNTQRKIRRP